MKFFPPLTFLLIAILILSGCNDHSGHKIINTNELNLVDSTGKTVAQLKVSDDGPGLFILDDRGRQRAVVIHQEDQTGFFILDTNGNTRVGAAHFSHGGSGFALHGENMKGATVVYMNPKSEGSVSIIDTSGIYLNGITSKK
jgi:hypothetical protein